MGFEVDVDSIDYGSQEFPFKEDSSLEIRPYPESMDDIIVKTTSGLIMSSRNRQKKFVYCLTGWKGIVGADGKPVPCTDDVKKKIFDFQNVKKNFAEMVTCVFDITDKFGAKKEKEEKD